MAIAFTEKDHKYVSIDSTDNTCWVSASKISEHYKNPFDSKTQAKKSASKKNSKWYGLKPDQIQKIWDDINKYSTDVIGTPYHNMREQEIIACEHFPHKGIMMPVIKPIIIDGIKYAPEQKLKTGIYPEHMMYLKSKGICGQSDKVIVNAEEEWVDVEDYKTNKSIDTTSYVDWEGNSKKMIGPLSHLDDCNYYHYALQLSIYMYMILKHNPKLKPRNIKIEHIIFEIDYYDDYDYPVYKLDENNVPVVKEIVEYYLPYLKDEVITILNLINQ